MDTKEYKAVINIDSITIKSKKDLKEKLQKGIDDIKNNKVYSLEEVCTKIDAI